MGNLNVTDFVENGLKDYSKYVLYRRAIPSVIDGFKTGQRKILWTAIKTAKDKNIKTASLSGNVISMANYHHGDTSLNEAISGLVQDFNNNAPVLHTTSSFGSRAVQVASAARYTYVKLSPNFKKYFTDTNLAPSKEDPEDPEPEYYLPLIPWVLINGVSGIAVGYATKILPHDPEVISKLCQRYLEGENIDDIEIPPKHPDFKGTYEKNERGGWDCIGDFELVGKKLSITEIPVGYDREKYVGVLEKLIDDKLIVRYSEPKAKGGGFRFDVVMRNNKDLTNKQIERMFKLRKSFSENLTVVDEHGRLKIFNSNVEIIKYYIDFRLKLFKVRYEKLIEEAKEEIRFKKEKLRFIGLVNSKTIDMKKKLKEIHRDIKAENFTIEDAKKLVGTPVYHLSQDKVDEIGFDISDLEADVVRYENINHSEQFNKELRELL